MSAQTDRVDAAQLAHHYALKALEQAVEVEAEHLDAWMRSAFRYGREATETKNHHGLYLKAAHKCRAARDRVETTERELAKALGDVAGSERS